MTTDLVKQLRKLSADNPSARDCIDVAADELERLCTENSALKREAWTWSKACETATKQLEPARADAARYRWLRERMLAADFDWNDSGECALVFACPQDCAVSSNLDATIDAAMLKTQNAKVQRDSGSIIAGGSAGTTGCASKVAK